jgi:hypothetical protein
VLQLVAYNFPHREKDRQAASGAGRTGPGSALFLPCDLKALVTLRCQAIEKARTVKGNSRVRLLVLPVALTLLHSAEIVTSFVFLYVQGAFEVHGTVARCSASKQNVHFHCRSDVDPHWYSNWVFELRFVDCARVQLPLNGFRFQIFTMDNDSKRTSHHLLSWRKKDCCIQLFRDQ